MDEVRPDTEHLNDARCGEMSTECVFRHGLDVDGLASCND